MVVSASPGTRSFRTAKRPEAAAPRQRAPPRLHERDLQYGLGRRSRAGSAWIVALIPRPGVCLDELRDGVLADVGPSAHAYVVDLASVDELVDAAGGVKGALTRFSV